jgi:hypothetical protein
MGVTIRRSAKEHPVKYLILIYSNPASMRVWEGFSDQQRADGFRHYAELHDDLVKSGELIAAEALADPSSGRRLPAAPDWAAMASDGPFAEAKEHLGGFFLVECDGMERAEEIARRIPEAPLGLVEIRPIMSYAPVEV